MCTWCEGCTLCTLRTLCTLCTLCTLTLCAVACSYTPAGRERTHAYDTLRSMKELHQVSVGCEGAILASDSLCADVVTSEGKALGFERVGFNSFGANATNVVVSEAAGLVPRIASCESVTFPNFHRDAALGPHFSPTLIDVKDAVTRSGEVLEEVQFWPQCPQSWDVQDKRGVNYRYCVRRKDSNDEPPRPAGCDQRNR
jgi:hypothetical protein